METSVVVGISTDLLLTTVMLVLPAVVVSLLVGILISVLQTITSIQEQTLTFAPRILAVAVVLILSMSWMLQTATGFTMRMMTHAVEAGG